MRTEAVTADMLPALREWWAGRDLGTLPDDVLPPVGFVASDAHGPAAAAWLMPLLTALTAWTVVNRVRRALTEAIA